MAYRECDEHGWLKTAEYAVTPEGQPVCPACENALTGYYGDDPSRRESFGGPTHSPRQRFVDAASEFRSRVEALDDDTDYWNERPLMSDHTLDG